MQEIKNNNNTLTEMKNGYDGHSRLNMARKKTL